jgi:hypothetical protein
MTETTSVYAKTDKHPTTARWVSSRALLAALVICGALQGIVPIIAIAAAEEQKAEEPKTFATADAAAKSLIAALGKDGVEDLLVILGREYELELFADDPDAGRKARGRLFEAARETNKLRDDGKDRKVLVIGAEAWPVPFPLVKVAGGWQFDTEAGVEEVVIRRIGANELRAVKICRAYIDAQVEYASADRDGDEVLEYAQVIGSTPGKTDGLFWEAGDGEELSPFGPLITDARDYLDGREIDDPFKGYYYKILTRQGASAPGGRYDYIINGNMIAGFGMIVFPADHGNSGIMTMMCNHQGKVYEKNFGPDSDLIAAGVETYNPDSSWTEVEE